MMEFNILFFGKSNELLAYFIYATIEMGKIGIGKIVDGKRGTFSLVSVIGDKDSIFDGKTNKIQSGSFSTDLPPLISSNHEISLTPIKAVMMDIQTQLRVKMENRLAVELPFDVLIRVALRRISSLYNHYCSGEPQLDYKGLVERARNISISKTTLEWFDWKRYSSRSDQKMLMGGIIGSAEYRGDVGEFLPILRMCEKFHIGKQTTFGLGKIRIMGEK